MTDVRTFFEKKYLGAWDVPEGKDVVLVIDRVEGSLIKGTSGEEKKAPVVYFSNVRDKKKSLVLNATNAKTISKLYGRHIEAWAGKPIAIFATKTLAFGEEVECIRVRPTAPPMPKGAGQAPLAAAPPMAAAGGSREPGEDG